MNSAVESTSIVLLYSLFVDKKTETIKPKFEYLPCHSVTSCRDKSAPVSCVLGL
jgi:hypothetical protein